MPGFYLDTRSWALTAAVLGFLLLPQVASRFITGWLYNGPGASVLIAGLFHAMHNTVVNSTGLGVAVLGLPQPDVLLIAAVLVVLAGAAVAITTGGRLGLRITPTPLHQPGQRPLASLSRPAVVSQKPLNRHPTAVKATAQGAQRRCIQVDWAVRLAV